MRLRIDYSPAKNIHIYNCHFSFGFKTSAVITLLSIYFLIK
jgi:hypothetical protein